MRKKLLGLIGLGTAAFLLLSGFDSAMTVQELQKNAAQAVKSVEQCRGEFSAQADVVVAVTQSGENGAQMSVPVAGNVFGDFAMIKEPVAVSMNMNFDGSGAGMAAAGSMELYLKENEDGTGSAYVHMVMDDEDTGWEASSVSAEDMAKAKEAIDKAMNGDLDTFLDENTSSDSDLDAEQLKELIAKYKETFGAAVQLSPEAAEVNGRDCYEAVLDITGDLLTGAITDAAEVAGEALDQSTMAIVQMVAAGLDIKVVTDYDAETFLPVSGAVDLTGSNFAMIAQIAASMMGGDEVGSVDLTVNALGANFSAAYNDFDTIEIPSEALSADMADASAALGAALGNLTDGSSDGDSDDAGDDYASDSATLNEDGSYHLEDTDFNGETFAADIAVPEGMTEAYSGASYISFTDEDYVNSVDYQLEIYSNADEALESAISTSYMEGDDSYSDIHVSEPVEVTLDNGITVKYANISYKYTDTMLGRTCVAIPAGDKSVLVQIELRDDNYDIMAASEEDVIAYASNVSIAG